MPLGLAPKSECATLEGAVKRSLSLWRIGSEVRAASCGNARERAVRSGISR